tara:strand:+ start:8366 stop:8557 length:192 start_codon:yes stop_codon:yes gene_type:complete
MTKKEESIRPRSIRIDTEGCKEIALIIEEYTGEKFSESAIIRMAVRAGLPVLRDQYTNRKDVK